MICHIIGVSPSGYVSPARPELEANSGGIYGWWGMDFQWASDGVRLAYARPDSIGIYDTRLDILQPLVSRSYHFKPVEIGPGCRE